MNNVLTGVLSDKARKTMYVVYGLIGLALGAVQVGFSSANVGQPSWLTISFAVFGFLASGFGLTAASNVFGSDTPAPAPITPVAPVVPVESVPPTV